MCLDGGTPTLAGILSLASDEPILWSLVGAKGFSLLNAPRLNVMTLLWVVPIGVDHASQRVQAVARLGGLVDVD
jgi:fumarate reductase subunit D